jgi:hypothetical protein
VNELSTERLFVIDPYNEQHRKMLRDFEEKNGLPKKMSDQLGKLCSSVPKEAYLTENKLKNELEENFFLEKENQIIDMCHLHIEKDIKIGRINLAPIKTKERVRKIIPLVNEYAFNLLKLEEIFIEVSPKDENLIHSLDLQNYENLGIQDGKIMYLKEKEEEKNIQRMIA